MSVSLLDCLSIEVSTLAVDPKTCVYFVCIIHRGFVGVLQRESKTQAKLHN